MIINFLIIIQVFMKKIILLVALFMFMIPVTVNAVTLRYSNVHPELKFDGTTAYCTASVTGDSMKDKIDIVVKLWKGKGCIATWKDSGVGYVFLSKSKVVEKNYEYTLTIDAKINGKTRPTASITAKCK